MYQYTECGLTNVYLSNGYQVTQTPYGEAVAVHDVAGLHKAIGRHMITTRARLNADEVRFLRAEMDLSQVQLAQCMGVVESSVRNWESTRNSIPDPADRLLRVLYAEFIDESTPIRQLIDDIARMNRKMYADKIQFGEDASGWHAAA